MVNLSRQVSFRPALGKTREITLALSLALEYNLRTREVKKDFPVFLIFYLSPFRIILTSMDPSLNGHVRKKPSPRIYQIKIVFLGTDPQIWRRILVRGSIDLYDFHYVIQVSMGWTNSHLHQYVINGVTYTDPYEELDPDYKYEDEHNFALNDVAHLGDRFTYLYDFGDSWKHEILMEDLFFESPGSLPICLDGERACPPEDCGGTPGFEELLQILQDTGHPEYQETKTWLHGFYPKYDPKKFDPVATTKKYRRIAKMKQTAEAGKGV